jgi:DNA-binding beta-propeller fold protein YncE
MKKAGIFAVVFAVVACGPGEAQVGDETLRPDVLEANAEDQAWEFTETEQGLTAPFGITGSMPASRVELTQIVAQLYRPYALAFKPGEGSLWIVNRGDDSSVIVDNPGKSTQKVTRFRDDSNHFMNNPTQLAFSKTKAEFAVSLDSVNDYNGQAAPNYFTGPTLFTANRKDYQGGAASHYDMLHHSPRSLGISVGARPATAAQEMREYWVFNGNSGAIDRYFFNQPHELGADDHSDGITIRYATGQLKRSGELPGHVAFDAATRQLYVADVGNNRIVRLDTRISVNTARRIPAYHSETALWEVPGAKVTVVTTQVSQPTGLLVVAGQLVVAEHATGKVKVFTTAGTFKGELDTGLGAGRLMGLAEGPDGKLYAVDAKGGRAVRVDIR